MNGLAGISALLFKAGFSFSTKCHLFHEEKDQVVFFFFFFLLDLSDRQLSLDLDLSDEFTDRGILQSCTTESVCHLRKLLERKTHSSEVSLLFINQGFLTVFLCLHLPKFSFVVLALAFLSSIA